MRKRRVVLFYHCSDVDGTSSASLMKYSLEHNLLNIPQIQEDDHVNVILKPWNYGFKFKTIYVREGDVVFLLDIHLPLIEMTQIADITGNKIYVLDHHESSFETLNEFRDRLQEDSIYNSDHSACIHVYNFVISHLRNNVSMKTRDMLTNIEFLFKLFELWDIHTYIHLKEGDEITPIQIIYMTYYLNSLQNDPDKIQGAEFWNEIFNKSNDIDYLYQYVKEMFDVGEVIYKALQKRFYGDLESYSFEGNFEGYKVLFANKYPGEGSSYFNEWNTEQYDILCNFYFSGKTNCWVFGMSVCDGRNISLLPIWKKYDQIRSGGHDKVGAFRCRTFTYDPNTKNITFTF